MNAAEAVELLAQIVELEEITKKLNTQDGRWDLLQEWLAKNPKWKKQVEKWVDLKPQAAFVTLRAWIAKQAEIPTLLMVKLINEAVESRALAAIAIVQQLYKERAGANKNKLRIVKGQDEDERHDID